MKKKDIKRKFELFKEFAKSEGKEIKKSKNGNYYIEYAEEKILRTIEIYSPFSVGLKNINKLFTKKFSQKYPSTILLLTKGGKLMIKNSSLHFSIVARKKAGIRKISEIFDINRTSKLLEIAFTGHPYLYLKDNYQLTRLNLSYEFTSKEDLYKFLHLDNPKFRTEEEKTTILFSFPECLYALRKLSTESRENFLNFIQIINSNRRIISEYFNLKYNDDWYDSPYEYHYPIALIKLSKYIIQNPNSIDIPENPQEFRRLLTLLFDINNDFSIVEFSQEPVPF